MRKGLLRAALAALAVLPVAGCDTWYNDVPSPDTIWHHVPWFDHMIYSRAVHPYRELNVPRYTVKGSVPITGSEGDWAQGDPAAGVWAFDTVAANRLQNPLKTGGTPGPLGPDVVRMKSTPEAIAAKGDTLFATYCSACHGIGGMGDGLVGQKLGAPSLMTDRAKGYTDGYLYSIIKYGRGLMPKYGDKLYDPLQRWAVVQHLRTLQGASATTKATGGEH